MLKPAVKRNDSRFPENFMFELPAQEFADWRSQFVTSKSDKMGLRHAPMVVTEQGVATDLKAVYQSATEVQAQMRLADFGRPRDTKQPTISKSWKANWQRLIPFIAYPVDIRQIIYTTNAIESRNYSLKKRSSKSLVPQ